MDSGNGRNKAVIHYRSVATLNRDIQTWLSRLPRDIEIVVGIPRSGLLVANLLSLYMDLPMTDVEGFLGEHVIQTGSRFMGRETKDFLCSKRRVLVIDDSLMLGRQMSLVKERIRSAQMPHEVKYGAVYVNPQNKNMVDFYYELLPGPRVFEWNVMQHGSMDWFCVDLDGVLCRDPTEEENDDSVRYREFITGVQPLFVPRTTIGWVVTCRLEKYREITEEWLRRHHIGYNSLVMLDMPDKDSRIRARVHAAFKAELYERTGALLFIESSEKQAGEIARLTGKDVLCFETRELLSPTRVNREFHRTIRFLRLLSKNPREARRLLRRHFL